MYFRTMLETSSACLKRDADFIIENIDRFPIIKLLLARLFTENVDEFVKTIRSIQWQLGNSKRRKTNWDGHFVLYRRGKIRVYGIK